MHDLDLPSSIWVEVAGTIVYIQNKYPHFILGDKTPKEKFTSVKLAVGHLRIFGYSVYIHVPKERISKLEPSGKNGIFLGYSETSKAYQIYVPSKKYIEVSRDVTFHEEAAFCHFREIPLDAGLEEKEVVASSGESLNEPPSPKDQREESQEGLDAPTEQPLERLLEDPPAKRRPAWCKEILQEEEGHAAPKGTFRESRKPQRVFGLASQVDLVIS